MNMNPQSEELARRMHAARLARVNVQRMRLLAAQRVEQLERELKEAAEAGLRAEISRSLEARARLQATVKPKSTTRISGIAALALVLAAGTAGLAWFSTQNDANARQTVRQAPLLGDAPGDRLQLAYSYSVSLPATR